MSLYAVFGNFNTRLFASRNLVLALCGHGHLANRRCRCAAVLLLAQVGEDQLARAGNPVRASLGLLSRSVVTALIDEADKVR